MQQLINRVNRKKQLKEQIPVAADQQVGKIKLKRRVDATMAKRDKTIDITTNFQI